MAAPYITSYGDTVSFTDINANMCLTANNAKTFTVPGDFTNKYSMRFSYTSTSNIFVGYNVTAVIPSSNTISSDYNIEFRPMAQRYVKGGDVISFISPDASVYAGISLRALPN